jgi:predicted RNA-binding protein with PIN domain
MRFLIVDAHSVIFSWPELRKLHQRRMILARDELIKILTQYQDASGIRVVAVFDGQGKKLSEATEPGGIQVLYSSSGQTADQIIERLTAIYAKTHDLTVATSDHLEQQTAETFGAYTVTCEELRERIADAQAELARELKNHRKRL